MKASQSHFISMILFSKQQLKHLHKRHVRLHGTFSSRTDRSREVASSSSAQQLTCETNPALQSCMMDLQKSILYDQTLRAHAEPVYRHNPASRHHKPKPSSAYLRDQTLETRMRCNIAMLRICKDLARLQRRVGQLKEIRHVSQ